MAWNNKISAGLLMFKKIGSEIKVFIVHPGGPYWKNKDDRAWSIPKGEVEEGEELLAAAKREFWEETGINVNTDKFIELGNVVQKSGKTVHGWAFEGDWSGLLMVQEYATTEWPPKSGKMIKFPEVDKAGFFSVKEAKKKMVEAQFEFVERLQKIIGLG